MAEASVTIGVADSTLVALATGAALDWLISSVAVLLGCAWDTELAVSVAEVADAGSFGVGT